MGGPYKQNKKSKRKRFLGKADKRNVKSNKRGIHFGLMLIFNIFFVVVIVALVLMLIKLLVGGGGTFVFYVTARLIFMVWLQRINEKEETKKIKEIFTNKFISLTFSINS